MDQAAFSFIQLEYIYIWISLRWDPVKIISIYFRSLNIDGEDLFTQLSEKILLITINLSSIL